MFTTNIGWWEASPLPVSTVWFGDQEVVLSHRGVEKLAARLAGGQAVDESIRAVLYDEDRDFGWAVVGWWRFVGEGNPWRELGLVQICRTVEYGRVHYTATCLICDHTSPTLTHLLDRLTRMQFGSARRLEAS